MLAQDLILKKRDNMELSEDEITWFINKVCTSELDNSQIAAFLMSVWFNKMSEKEKVALTNAMKNSGNTISWDLPGPIVDKHSTGGVGDTTSLILAPILACLGCYVPMISGKGLGHTGGTLDKLTSIPGYNITQSETSFKKIVKEIGCAIVGQSSDLAPADKILYSIRDVTGTIDSIDLITASILSKKLAGGIKNLILDVKVGNGSFMTNIEDAEMLGRSLVSVANASGCKSTAFINRMDEPLNSSVGNALEIKSSIDMMVGEIKNHKLLETTIDLSTALYLIANPHENSKEIKDRIKKEIASGNVAERFEKMVSALGGPKNILTGYSTLLPKTKKKIPVFSHNQGYITDVQTKRLGMLLIKMGGGRRSALDKLHYAVGFSEICSLNFFVSKKQPILFMHVDDNDAVEEITREIQNCFKIEEKINQTAPSSFVKRIN